jgi:hypothetical protein
VREQKEELPKKFIEKDIAEGFAHINILLKKSESMNSNTKRFALIERSVHDAFSAYEQVYDGQTRKQANQY